MRSTATYLGLTAWTIVACGSRIGIDEPGDASPTTTSGSGGESGSGGGKAGSGGAGGAGGAIQPPPPLDDAGAPGTQPSCSSLVGMLNAQGWIAFDSDHDNFHRNLYMMHADRSSLTQLTTGLNNDREPFFSPDGKQLSFTSNVAGNSQIFLMDVATRAAIKLTNRAEGADESSFSRDGQWVAFHSGASVYIIKVDGSGEQLVATGLAAGSNAYHWPAFSADGTELVFDRYNEIDATKLDGTGFRYVVGNTTAQIKSPAVSPAGADVAYQVGCYNDGGILSIWTTPFATQTRLCEGRRVTPPDGRDSRNPAWVTSTVIAYERVDKVTNLGTVAIISREAGSMPCILTPAVEDSRNPTWSSL
jgi:Tol biopolymer transport system component